MAVIQNLHAIELKIDEACSKTGRTRNDVHIIAVTKYVSIERAKEAIEAGVIHLGENRDDGFLKKWNELGNNPIWHFIGSLQSKKVKNIIDKVDYIHSLDRFSLALEINKRASRKTKCFIQVNVSGEKTKHGITPQELLEFVKSMEDLENIEIVGLMTMAPNTDDQQVIRTCFHDLRLLRDSVQELKIQNAPCRELSMGMSNDFEIAVEEGATYIRLGTSLVGQE